MSNMLLMEKQARLTVRFELNALLDQSPETPLSARVAPLLRDPPGTVEFLIEQARAQGPLYRQALHEESHARAQLRRSRLSYAPDLAVMYDRSKDDDGMTGYEAGVSASVPLWWSRPQGERREAIAHLESAQASARAMENEVVRAVATERGEVATRLALARSFETVLLPAARSSLELSRRRFESGSFPFVQFLEALRTLSAAEIDYQDSLVQYAVHWGMLEEWVGVPLDTLPH
jgi:cobalt-zinc-cadmium efflux system outer membrane protein